jgi:hypothetical protein
LFLVCFSYIKTHTSNKTNKEQEKINQKKHTEYAVLLSLIAREREKYIYTTSIFLDVVEKAQRKTHTREEVI